MKGSLAVDCVDATLGPFRLQPEFRTRPWGRHSLLPWYSAEQMGAFGSEPIGEAWLNAPESRIETGSFAGRTLAELAVTHPQALLGRWQHEGEFPLLLKILFTEDKLSVQVHPDDEGARASGYRRGKTECWYTLEARPGAQVALGWKPGTGEHAIRDAIRNGTLEDLLQSIAPHAGDLFFVDAGTVHSIGPGLTLLETQQTSDITYRLYDYGRPRELHVDAGLRAMHMQTSARRVEPESFALGTHLVRETCFTVDRMEVAPGTSLQIADAEGTPHVLVALTEGGTLESAQGSVEFVKGLAVIVPASSGAYTVHTKQPLTLVRAKP